MSLYGPLVTVEDVRLALTAHLRTWAPSYIAEVARQRSTTLPGFRGYTVETGDDFPVCITACAGTTGDLIKHGDGKITAAYTVGAAAVAAAPTREEATALAGYYGAAIRGAVVQHPDLSGYAAGCEWTGETVEEVAYTSEQAIVACTERFTIWVDDVTDTRGGPLTPPVDPDTDPGEWPTVDTVTVTVVREPNT